MNQVSKYIGGATLAVALMAAFASSAYAWSRSSSTTGPRGNTWTSNSSGSCSGSSCSHSGTKTGPRGNSVTRSGETNCSGGTCNHTGTVTGPYGGSVTRNSTISR